MTFAIVGYIMVSNHINSVFCVIAEFYLPSLPFSVFKL